MKLLHTIFKLPKLAMAVLLLLFFYIVETILMVIYLAVEKPLSWLLDAVESIIKYLVKTI